MSTDKIIVRNPATLQVVGELAVAQPADVVAAVERGRVAQAIWRQTSLAQRAQILYRLRDLLLDEGEKLADILTSETGRPRAEVYGNELFYLCDAIGMWAKKSSVYLRPEKIRPSFPLLKAKKVISAYQPHGVIGIISPWNFPLTLTLGEAIPALMAGNAVVIKPSELTPLSALFGAEIAAKSGFPENLLQVVAGYGAAGEALIDCADMIAFTGSVETGKTGDAPRSGPLAAGFSGARWQRSDDRSQRRRSRSCRRRLCLGRVDELRPNLHVHRARLCRGTGLCAICR